MNIPANSIRFSRTAAVDGGVPCEPIRLVQYDKTMPVAAIALDRERRKVHAALGRTLKSAHEKSGWQRRL